MFNRGEYSETMYLIICSTLCYQQPVAMCTNHGVYIQLLHLPLAGR